ncbi:DUF481 domain-containing protein [Marinigracilibium pacificum]|uniref:DUF481 domain-containing protein n=1 Tax=Marinigracilibium pacificum TaxID=2729599 RepID=A0A848IWD1_9BACT|nr:DUF481 domain-containing protein [Marinigracilibium pacificum]NMM47585.1 DUF481 domain-containing protein [Marinigracilibium pacificum]
MRKLIILTCLSMLCIFQGFTQDSLLFNNGNIIVGEIQSMNKGVLTIETDYSDNDFTIMWEDIKEIYTESLLTMVTVDGDRYYGTLKTKNGQFEIIEDNGTSHIVERREIVNLKPLDKGFLDRLYAGIDLGYTLTRARTQRQFTLRSRAGYMAERWSLDMNFNTLSSKQDDSEDIDRTDGNVAFRYILPHEWFVMAQVDFLSSSDQLLDLRTNTRIGAGKFLVRTNRLYWGLQGGVSWNNENYQGENNDRKSTEAWIGSEVNVYDIGDLSLLANVVVYPSLTESGRVRVDHRLDLKYDLPLDFYIKTGLTLNYDSEPIEGGVNTDYVWQTSFGWSW